jgi:DMSO/TMAO reductase YedYZ molybdopterin-dependent catalytic subunit
MAGAACLNLFTPQNSATVTATNTASSQKGGSSPILWPLVASMTPSEPNDNQIAIPVTSAVRRVETDTPRTTAAYVKKNAWRLEVTPPSDRPVRVG